MNEKNENEHREQIAELIEENSMAPDITLLDLDGKLIKLSDFRDKKKVVVYFYPKDFTPGCTTEAAEFTREYSKFKEANIEIIGVSPDNDDSHRRFRHLMKIPYLLASDTQNEISKKYGVYGIKKFMGRECMGINRSTFLIDKNGKVIKIYPKVKPMSGKGFADEYINIFEIAEKNNNNNKASINVK